MSPPCAGARSRSRAGGRCVSSAAPRGRASAARAVTCVVIAAGGTAGHVVPALAVADALRTRGASVAFIGGERAEAELVPAAGYALHRLRVARPRARAGVGGAGGGAAAVPGVALWGGAGGGGGAAGGGVVVGLV